MADIDEAIRQLRKVIEQWDASRGADRKQARNIVLEHLKREAPEKTTSEEWWDDIQKDQ